jgi:hypothetical protein
VSADPDIQRILVRFHPDAYRPVIDCGPGWYPLLLDLDADLARIDPDYVVVQVKEKFATLRYYIRPDSADRGVWERMEARKELAYELSARTCELCGAPGSRHASGARLRTLCPECVESENASGMNSYIPAPPGWTPGWSHPKD